MVQIALLAMLALLPACSSLFPAKEAVPTSAIEQARAVKCERGLTRIEQVRGLEDGFALGNDEPARIRPARLPNPYLEAISKAESGVMQLRDYDEGGQDGILIDHFDAPRGIVSGALIVGLKPTAGSDNDAIQLGNLDEHDVLSGFGTRHNFGLPVPKDVRANESTAVTIPLERLHRNIRAAFKGDFLSYLNTANRPEMIDFEVEDDTAVDVAILIMCQEPQEQRGTSFAEYRAKLISPNISFMSCFADRTQAPCNPFSGDTLCAAKLPVACYKAGGAIPQGLSRVGLHIGTGGELRLSEPIAGNQFKTQMEVSRYCTSQFGAGWRVLSYHDGSGGSIVTNGHIPPKARAWIDVQGKPYANCWDRERAQ